ncbi:transaldolase family protein [Petroclostridium sp. X23]|uniref:transaldolase family protein n=1 Tax=Petroclostridium sp. X23 TaxID=3045146 RepID=UPI0024AD5509|nr:transaldolase family protein [Petroclostridium sp. X23]WHH58799.1 transaldolase family protein [Petroclostridium sp. X23]
MSENTYLKWMAENTDTQWCNDSALVEDLKAALSIGAIGCTSNPPLSYQALTETSEIFKEAVEKIPADLTGDDRVVELIGAVVKHISNMLSDMFEKEGGLKGYIRAQVKPKDSANAEAMLRMGKTFASWGKNIMVKIPGTAAGIEVLEELAALGIPTNPTVCVSVSQIVAAAEAHERGVKRAIEAGIEPAPSTAAIVMGRLQDYLAALNKERNAGVSTYDLECASLAVAKRSYQILKERGFKTVLMPAAFRCARHVSEMVGSNVVMTIHPKYQEAVKKAEEEGTIRREISIDKPVDADALERVSKALPEFTLAYEPDGLAVKDFDTFGATVMTLEGFDVTGWQKLLTL